MTKILTFLRAAGYWLAAYAVAQLDARRVQNVIYEKHRTEALARDESHTIACYLAGGRNL